MYKKIPVLFKWGQEKCSPNIKVNFTLASLILYSHCTRQINFVLLKQIRSLEVPAVSAKKAEPTMHG